MRSASSTIAAGVERRVPHERARRGEREVAAGADGADAVLGLDHVAGAGDDERRLAVGHDEQRLEPAEQAVGAPVLRQLDRGAPQVAVHLLQLRLEALEQRERVGARAGEAGEHAVVVAGGGPSARCASAPSARAVTWPSPPSTTRPRWRTERMVVPCSSGSRVRAVIGVHQAAEIDVGVALRGGEARVAEQLLDGAQVGAARRGGGWRRCGGARAAWPWRACRDAAT